MTRQPGLDKTAFEDEALYLYMGHRMLEHLTEGAHLFEYPGSYFSGAPGLYPVLAALADGVAGLQGARSVSLVFALVATLGVYGLGDQLFGRRAGLLGAASLATCGSFVYVSNLATYDSMMMALGAWFTVYSVRHDGQLWAPAIGLVLAVGILTKYAGVVYAPVCAALAVAVGWQRLRWLIVRRAAFLLTATGTTLFLLVQLWGRDLIPGMVKTTSDRVLIQPTPRDVLVRHVVEWAGGGRSSSCCSGRRWWRPSSTCRSGR